MLMANLMRSNATNDSKRNTLPDKTAVYATLSDLNRNLEQVLLDLERLKTVGLFRSRFRRESLVTCRASLEEIRAWINFEATETLHEREEHDRAHFGRIRRRWEKKYEDPHDVLIEAERFKKKIAKKSRS
jgi:hypothetical protein